MFLYSNISIIYTCDPKSVHNLFNTTNLWVSCCNKCVGTPRYAAEHDMATVFPKKLIDQLISPQNTGSSSTIT